MKKMLMLAVCAVLAIGFYGCKEEPVTVPAVPTVKVEETTKAVTDKVEEVAKDVEKTK